MWSDSEDETTASLNVRDGVEEREFARVDEVDGR